MLVEQMCGSDLQRGHSDEQQLCMIRTFVMMVTIKPILPGFCLHIILIIV